MRWWKIAGVFLLILVGGYFFFGKEKISQGQLPNFSYTGIKDFLKQGGTKITSKAKEFFHPAAEVTEEFVTGAIQDAKDKTIQTAKSIIVKEATEKAVEIGQNLGIPIAAEVSVRGQEASSQTIGFSIKVGSKAHFVIRNSSATGMDYKIDWQDGQQEQGQISASQSQQVSHQWDKIGDYLINFQIENGGESKQYQVLISIF